MVRLRALLSLLVLALFPVVVLAVLALVTVAAVAIGRSSGSAGTRLELYVVVPLVLALFAAVREALRARPQPSQAPELTRSQHPELWREVDALAHGIATQPPARIVVTPEVNASVTEAGGHREMQIGLPLLAGMDRRQLVAVLAHELGHYGAGHTRLLAVSYRARDAVLGTVRNLSGGPARWLLSGYARLYLVVAAWANRAQEREADDYAARVVGAQVTASALRRVLALDVAWDRLVEDYVPLADVAERRPDLSGGLVQLLGARRTELDEVAGQLLQAPTSAYDSHPSTGERIARLVPGPADTAAPAQDEPAWTLLGQGRGTLTEVEDSLLVGGERADWETLVALGGERIAAHGAGQLARSAEQAGLPAPVTLDALLDAVERGEGGRLVAALVNPGVPVEHRAEAERVVLTEHLVAAVVHALCASGRAVHRLSWTGPLRLVAPATGEAVDVEPLVAAAVEDPSAVPAVRALLGSGTAARVEAVAEGEPQMVAVETSVRTAEKGTRHDLVVCDTGLLLVPAQPTSRWTSGWQAVSGQRRAQEAERLQEGVTAMRALPGARWIDTDDVVAGTFGPRPYGWLLQLRLRDGEELRVRTTSDSNSHGEPVEAVMELLGARGGKQAWRAAAG